MSRHSSLGSIRRPLSALVIAAGVLGVAAPSSLGQADSGGKQVSIAELTDLVWASAQGGRDDLVLQVNEILSKHVASNPKSTGAAELRGVFASLREGFEAREAQRSEKLDEIRDELKTALEEVTSATTQRERADAVSGALRHAVAAHETLPEDERDAFLRRPEIQRLVSQAERAAGRCENDGDLLVANELFYRLSVLFDQDGRYKGDLRRVGERLSMVRLYAPERFWELRNELREARGDPSLPEYNGLGEDYGVKLVGVNEHIVAAGVTRAAFQHVRNVELKDMIRRGLESVRTMVTTEDLHPVFTGLQDDAARQRMLGFIEREIEEFDRRLGVDQYALTRLIAELRDINNESVRIDDRALMHEFGNGAMSATADKGDDYTAIIWPDEVRRFERSTQGKLKGVGIQIRMDEETQMIRVVTPLEGAPAQRAGVRTGDLIKKIDGKSAVGITLQQAVDLITGKVNTPVNLTMEREGEDIDFRIVRAEIPLVSVKGWRRNGPREDAWDWFIDNENRIGYVRLTQFQQDTTNDLRRAVREMQRSGELNGLILDLRFNPGGYLTEAVGVAGLFIDRGVVVTTKGTMRPDSRRAGGNAMLDDTPVAVLINNGSASASEIVSGAIKHYADLGRLDAVVVGSRSFGKGSVQNVWDLGGAMVKVTTQHYYPAGAMSINKEPGSEKWGVDPHFKVEMLLDQVSEALTIRQDADTLPLDEHGNVIPDADRPDPDRLLTENIDLQLKAALAMLQAKAIGARGGDTAHAMRDP